MKQSILLLVLVMSIILVGCSASSPTSNQQGDIEKLQKKIAELEKENSKLKARLEDDAEAEASVPVDSEDENISTFQIGDTIKTDKAEITIKNIEFSYDILPDDTSSFYTHYEADSGHVYIHIDTDVKNIQKQSLSVDSIMTVEANYNDGYTYNDFPVPEDSSTGFTYANITSIKPLESLGVRFIIDCPQEVEENNNSLFLTFKIDKNNYVYTMR